MQWYLIKDNITIVGRHCACGLHVSLHHHALMGFEMQCNIPRWHSPVWSPIGTVIIASVNNVHCLTAAAAIGDMYT